MMTSLKINRRSLLGAGAAGASLLASACATGAPLVKRQRPLRLAMIGVSNRAKNHYSWASKEEVTALVDCDTRMFSAPFIKRGKLMPNGIATERFPNAALYDDYRDLFEKPDTFDAVIVSTPDHTHFAAARRAIELGKPVYCEKPLTFTAWESQKLSRLTQKNQVATQMGNQGIGYDGWRKAHSYYHRGLIGEVRKVHIWQPVSTLGDNGVPGAPRPTGKDPVPDGFDWELWTGPAPMRAHVEDAYHPKKWRQIVEYGNGTLGDWWCHKAPVVFKVLEPGHPTRIKTLELEGWNKESWPVARKIQWSYPAISGRDGFELFWHDGGKAPSVEELGPHWPEGQEIGPQGVALIGDKGVIFLAGQRNDDAVLFPHALQEKHGGSDLLVPAGRQVCDEFLAAAKGEDRWDTPSSYFPFAGHMTSAALLANAQLLSGKDTLEFDPETGRVLNHEGSLAPIKRAPRAGWEDYA